MPAHRSLLSLHTAMDLCFNMAASKQSFDLPAINGIWYVKDRRFANFILQSNKTYLLLVLH